MSINLIPKSIFLFFLALISFSVNAQTSLNPYAVDLNYLSQLIKQKVDIVRHQYNLKPLKIEEHLDEAALIQTNYLKTQNSLSHINRNAKFKTVEKRVLSTGVSDFGSGENLATGFLYTTYETTADSIVQGWVNSSGHFQNIISKDWEWTGVAISATKDDRLIIAQVFATNGINLIKGEDYKIKNAETEKLPFRIKPYQENYESDLDVKKAQFVVSGYRISSENVAAVKKLFKGPKDGIVFELVLGSQISCNEIIYCNSYNRRNNTSSVNGRLYFPHYSKELLDLKNFRKTQNEFKKEKQQKIKELQSKISKIKRKIVNTKRNISKFKNTKNPNNEKSIDSTKALLQDYQLILKTNNQYLIETKREKWNPQLWSFNFPEDHIYSPENIAEINILLLKNNQIVTPLYYKEIIYKGEFKDSIIEDVSWEFDQPVIEISNVFHKKNLKIYYKRGEYKIDKESLNYLKKRLSNFIINSIHIDIYSSQIGLR